MRKPKDILLFAIVSVTTLMAAGSCDIHEFPEYVPPPKTDITLHLVFDTELPLYKTINYSTRKEDSQQDFNARYVVKVFKSSDGKDFTRTADTTMTFTQGDISALNYDTSLKLVDGFYKFLVWTDYTEYGSADDLYYNTGDFTGISLMNKEEHAGGTDFRDAFRGEQTAAVSFEINAGVQDVTVNMVRPLAKYSFVSTDYQEFIAKEIARYEEARKQTAGDETTKDGDTKTINLDDYYAVFTYSGFMPCSFNNFINKPSDAWTGIEFKSKIKELGNNEVELGFDYVFVNGAESGISVAMALYTKEGEMITSTVPIDVPLVRSQWTLVKGTFLTMEANGNVGISADFDGEWNYRVY